MCLPRCLNGIGAFLSVIFEDNMNQQECSHKEFYLDYVESLMDNPHKICVECDADLGEVEEK